jgi:hypothetical protein
METDLADIRKVYVKNTAETLLEVQKMKQLQDEDREVFQSIIVTLQKRIDDLSKT